MAILLNDHKVMFQKFLNTSVLDVPSDSVLTQLSDNFDTW